MIEPDERWYQTLETLGANAPGADDVFAELRDRHADPGRHHHSFEHASAVVDLVLALQSTGDPWAPAVAAAWFHDAVHDPTAAAGANEGASAVFATACLERLGAPFTVVGDVARLICLTANHRVRPGDRAGALLCDADLAILGADASRYDRYVADVRAEYAHVSDADWVTGRGAVLRSFLDRPTIFHSEEARSRWESAARGNISRELEALVGARSVG